MIIGPFLELPLQPGVVSPDGWDDVRIGAPSAACLPPFAINKGIAVAGIAPGIVKRKHCRLMFRQLRQEEEGQKIANALKMYNVGIPIKMHILYLGGKQPIDAPQSEPERNISREGIQPLPEGRKPKST